DDDDVIDAHVPFSEMTEFQYKRIYKGVTINDKHVNETTPLPKAIMDGIRDDYARYIITRGAPWEQNEAQRRAYIASVLDRCIVAVNTAFPVKEELKLLAEYPIDCDGLRAGETRTGWSSEATACSSSSRPSRAISARVDTSF
ncbi:hypothetical protein PR001_g25427, partial [Phytophthora rubi]